MRSLFPRLALSAAILVWSLYGTQAFHPVPTRGIGKSGWKNCEITEKRCGWSSALFVSSSTSKSNPSTTTPTTTTTAAAKLSSDSLPRGDARGAAVLLEGVSVNRGAASILENIDWRVEPKSKWAVIGTNGAGKSTLLKAMMGELPYDGAITIGTTQTIGYLQQTAVAGSTRTVMEEAASAMKEIARAQEALHRAQESVSACEHPSKEQLQALDRAMQNFEMVGGYKQEQEVASMLKGLGFQNLTQRCDELSGGWQMRVSFAKTLLSKPTLCILDEPGNHLDRNARQWLAQYLKNYDGGAMILVTHDIELLQAMQNIAEVNAGGKGLSIYKSCSYSQYLNLKQERQEALENDYQKNADKAAKLQAFVDRFGASATKASAAQSRVKQLEKMQQNGLLDTPLVQQRFRPRLKLPDPPSAAHEILVELKHATVGHSPDQALMQDVNLQIGRGMKVLIRGPNGAGKSTLLHSLRGALPLLSGERTENPNLRLGVFTQDLAQELDPEEQALSLVTEVVRNDFDMYISDEQARSALGALGLSGEKALRRLKDLSGGEKARVALGIFALKPCNLYLLDEVSNHLDAECVEALSEALCSWGKDMGSVVVISHDKAFCDKLEFTHVVTVDNGIVRMEQREVRDSDWETAVLTQQRRGDIQGPVPTDGAEMDSATRKKAFNAPKRIRRIEELIAQKESEIVVLDEEMVRNGSDVGRLVELTNRRNAIDKEVAALMEEWEELEALLNKIQQQKQ